MRPVWVWVVALVALAALLAWLLPLSSGSFRPGDDSSRDRQGPADAPTLDGHLAAVDDAARAELDEDSELFWALQDSEASPTGKGWFRVEGRLVGAWPRPAVVLLEHHTFLEGPERFQIELPEGMGSLQAKVDDDGGFRFSGALPGVHKLRVLAPSVSEDERELEVWTHVQDLEVTLPSHVLEGRVDLDPVLAPEDVRVLVTAQRPVVLFGAEQGHAVVGADGSFRVDRLQPGPSVLTVSWKGRWERNAIPGWTSKGEASFPLDLQKSTTTWRGRIPARASLAVEIVGRGLDDPVRGEIRVRSRGLVEEVFPIECDPKGVLRHLRGSLASSRMAASSEGRDGRGVILDDLPSGPVTVVVDLKGFEPSTASLELGGTTRHRVDLAIARGRWVHVSTEAETWRLEVRDPVASEAWESLLWADDRVHWRWRHRTGRAYLREGTYEFRFVSRGHVTAQWGPERVVDSEAPLTISPPLQAGLRLHGEMRIPESLEMSHIPLWLFRFQADKGWVRDLDQEVHFDGPRYAFRGLAPGRYRISPSTTGVPVMAEVVLTDADVERSLALAPPEEGAIPPPGR